MSAAIDLSTMFGLEGRIALVTGAGRGLGRGLAEALAAAGAHVVCAGRSLPDLEETAARITGAAGSAAAERLDVTDLEAVSRLIDGIVERHGSLDILVNNAGLAIVGSVLEVAEEEYNQMMAVNLKGTFFASQAAARRMVQRRRGKIINVGSLASQIGLAGSSVYSASKGGVLQLTRAFAVELAPYNIQVNAIGPGYFRTEMTERFLQDADKRHWIEGRIPLGRLGMTADLAGCVVLLAGPGSDYITGQILYVDGGWLAG